jgi:transposase
MAFQWACRSRLASGLCRDAAHAGGAEGAGFTTQRARLVHAWAFPVMRGGDKRTVIMREIVNGLMYILSTGCQWRAIPKDLPPRSTLYDYFDLWSWDGTLDHPS